jgi:hypothetical protein
MGSFQHPRSFQPLELEIIDYVYDAAWAQIEALDPFRDRNHDWVRQAVLRKQVMDSAGTGKIEFDTLYEKVLGAMPEHWATFTALGP